MGSKSQTRIFARVNGEPRRLLSITEKNDGKLILTGAMETHALNENLVPTHPIVQKKMTVHRTGDALDGGNQIHHVTIYKDRPRIDNYLYTLAINRGLIQPLYLQVLRDVTSVDQKFIISPYDSPIEICDYDPRKHSLIISVLIGPCGADERYVQLSHKFNIKVVSFGNFTIFLAWCFAIGPSKDSWYHWVGTAPPKVGGVAPQGGGPLIPANGLSPKDVRLWLESQLLLAHLRAHRQNLEALKAASGEVLEVASAMALAGVFKVPHDIDDRPLRKLRSQVRTIFERYDRERNIKQ